jgi:hypothetical protein
MTKIITKELTGLSDILEFERRTGGPDRWMQHPRLYLLGFSDGFVKVGITGGKIKSRIQSILTVRRNNGNLHGVSMISLTIPHVNSSENEKIILNRSGFTKAHGEYLRDDFDVIKGILYNLDIRTEYTDDEKAKSATKVAALDRIFSAVRTGDLSALPIVPYYIAVNPRRQAR